MNNVFENLDKQKKKKKDTTTKKNDWLPHIYMYTFSTYIFPLIMDTGEISGSATPYKEQLAMRARNIAS